MSPLVEPTVLAGDRFSLLHIGPRAQVWPTSPAANITVLGRSDMVARPLPSSNVPSSPDCVSGQWTGRLLDSGELSLTFPNRESGDGVPWRSRFDPSGHLQFVAILDNGLLDSCCVIDTARPDQQQVVVHGQDGWFLLKKAYERDWIVVQAPRDVVERATQVWVPVLADNFPAGTLNPQWSTSATGGTVTLGASGGLTLTAPAGGGSDLKVTIPAAKTVPATGAWTVACTLGAVTIGTGGPPLGSSQLSLTVTESSGDQYTLGLGANSAGQIYTSLSTLAGNMGQTQVAAAATYDLRIESDGEWVSAFVNGQRVGGLRRAHATTTSLLPLVEAIGNTSTLTATMQGFLLEGLQPFLQRGADKGDYVLPGNASTLPNGGLHARYFNDLDLQSDANRLLKIHHPSRTQAYAGSGVSEYANQQDPAIGNGQQNPTPGAATSNWSAIWFGAIYLKLSAGDYQLSLTLPVGSTAARVWVGKTKFGDQLLDQWVFQSTATYVFTVSASALAGTLPYGGGTVQRDGWYPIKVEYAVDSTAATGPQLKIVSAPTNYTDPGGTPITTTYNNTCPGTSLSPLGCVDQRYQGVSHYDLAQQTCQAYDYQASVEPQRLESGLFPGVLAPRVREGHDTSIILKPDRGPRQDGEGILNYSSTLDATDYCSSLQGNGAGFQNGNTGQLQSLGYDAATLNSSLFDAQGWQDFSDASFLSLLQALLNAQLGLRLTPWQLLSADPTGRPRQAFTWPLPGNLAAMRWRPGDSVRIHAADINVWDTTPRQMLVVTRNLTPNGYTSMTASFANRPRNAARTQRQQLYSASRWQRNYQRQLVTLTGSLQDGVSIAAGADGPFTIVELAPSDQIVRAYLRVAYNQGGVSLNVKVNGTDVTTTLNGPWTTVPLNLNVGAVASVNTANNLNAVLHNNSGGTATTVSYALFVDVLR